MTVQQIFDEKNKEVFAAANIDPIKDFNELTDEELKELEHQYQLIAQKGLTNEKNVNLDDLLEQIKELIDKGELTDESQIKKYIDSLELKDEEKQQLLNNSVGYLNSKSKDTQITRFKDKLLNYLRKPRKQGTSMLVNFEVKGNAVGEQLCNVKLTGEMDGHSKDFEEYTFYYTDELKKELIEPIIEEMVLKDPVVANDYAQSQSSIGYRSDYSLATTTNSLVNLNNCEQNYAQFLKQRVSSLANTSKMTDPSQRDAAINQLKEDRDYEQDMELDKPMIRKLEKNEGFVSLYYISAAIATLISLFSIISVIFK